MVRVRTIIKYGVKEFFRRKDVLFWTLAWPILWLVLVAYVFIPSPTTSVTVKLLVINGDAGPSELTYTPPYANLSLNFSEDFMKVLKSVNGSEGIIYKVKVVREVCSSSECLSKVRELLIRRGYDAAIVIPRNATASYILWYPIRLRVFIKGASPMEVSLRYGYLMNLLSKLMVNASMVRINEATNFVSKYMSMYGSKYFSNQTPSNFSISNYSKYIKYFFYGIAFPLYPNVSKVVPKTVSSRAGNIGWTAVGAVGMSVMTGLLVSAAGFFAYRKEEGVLRRLLASPVSLASLITTDILENLVITAIVSAIIMTVGLAIGGKFVINPTNPLHYLGLGMIFVAALFAYALGLLLAPVTKSGKAASGAVAIGLLLVFITGIWWPPRELLPPFLRTFAQYFPPACAFEVTRDLIVWGKPLSDVTHDLLVALVGTALIYVVVALIYRGRVEKFAERVLSA